MLLFALEVLLVVLALISCLSAEGDDLRALPRIVWVIIILLFPLVGSIVYFVAGRPLRVAPAPPGSGISRSGYPDATRPRRVLAPDDDPEFLRTINNRAKREDEELLRRWEDDLRQRELNPSLLGPQRQ
jgi:hypothetical protein